MRAAPAPAAVIHPTVSDHSSDDEVLSAEQPQRGLKRSRADAVATTANAAGSAAADDAAEADQPARKLAKAKHMPRPASAQSYESGQLSPSEYNQDLPAPAAAPKTVPDPGPAPVQAALPALPLGPAQHPAPPQDTEYATHAVNPHGVAPNRNRNVQERMAAVLGIRTPAERVALRDAAGPTLADLLNPNNAAYDPAFAAQHRAMRAQANPLYAQQKARKQVIKLIKKLHWDKASAFTIEEHGYLLDLHGDVSKLVAAGMCIHTRSNICLWAETVSICCLVSSAGCTFQKIQAFPVLNMQPDIHCSAHETLST